MPVACSSGRVQNREELVVQRAQGIQEILLSQKFIPFYLSGGKKSKNSLAYHPSKTVGNHMISFVAGGGYKLVHNLSGLI